MTDRPENLEQLVHSLARRQPLRRAPASLEARVMAQIAARQAPVPWWRRSFAQWPVAARVGFLITSYGFVRLALAGFMSVTSWVHSNGIAGLATLHRAGEVYSSTDSVVVAVLNAIPPLWLYGAAVVAIALYAALFGLSAVAYRTLYAPR
jgi:hypothetical protein